MITIAIQNTPSLKQVLETCRAIRDLPDEGDVCIDFDQMGIMGPFGLLMISSVISRTRNNKPKLIFTPRHYAHHGYCSHMAFFRACGFQYGKDPTISLGSDTCIPIFKQATGPLHAEYRDTGRPLGELVEEEALALAEVLCQSKNGDLHDALTFALREIMRNTFEHSRSPSIEYCAQYWPEKDRVEIAVIDRGIGLYRSLKENKTLKVDSERHAINMAMLPGISRNVSQNKGWEEPKNIWQNSGFGLFMTQRMSRAGGDFFLASGASGRYLRDDRNESRWFDFGFEGTAVRIVLRPSSIGNVSAALKVYEKDAKAIARTNNIRIPNASTASRMIRLDFNRLGLDN